MRRLLFAVILAVALVPWSPALAQYYPQGSYQQSCTNLRMNGPVLSAVCNGGSGGSVRSSIDTSTCPNGFIENRNGYLACNGSSGGGMQLPLPAGSYRQSCQNVSMRGSVLRGRCQSSNGGLVASRLDIRSCPPRSQVGNINGNLVCQGGGYGGGYRPGGGYNPGFAGTLPAGSYQQSCRNLRMDGAYLRGACQYPNGGYNNNASVNVSRCRPGSPINNVNGFLECAAYRN